MKKNLIITALLILFVSACAHEGSKTHNAQPEWVMSESQQYPRSQFLTGVGEADTMEDARTRARAELAKIFSVNIQSTSSDVTAYEQSRVAGISYTTDSLAVSRDIRSSTEQRLEGVKVPELWKSPLEQHYYALAILPRQTTTLNLRTDITQLDEATSTLITRTQQSKSLIEKIRLSNETIPLQQKRRVLNKQLQVVSLTGQSVPSQWPVEKLQLDHAALIARITITVNASGLNNEKLQTSVEDTLASKGFTVIPEGAYQLNVNLDSTALPPQGQWYYEKANLSISLVGDNKKSLGGHAWDFKVSSSDPTLTELRVLEQAKKQLQTELQNVLFNMLGSNS